MGQYLDIMGKAIEHANPQSLVGWILPKLKNNSLKQICVSSAPSSQVKSLQAPTRKKTEGKQQISTESACEQHFKFGCYLTCGRLKHFATQCPSPVQAPTALLRVKKPGSQQAQKSGPVKPMKKPAKSTLADLLEAARLRTWIQRRWEPLLPCSQWEMSKACHRGHLETGPREQRASPGEKYWIFVYHLHHPYEPYK